MLRGDVTKFIQWCGICQAAKGHSQNTGLYSPLLILNSIWEDISTNFVLGLPMTPWKRDLMFVVMNRFTKNALFIPYCKIIDIINISVLFFCEIVQLHGVPKTIISDCDIKFLNHFWRILWKKFDMALTFSSTYHPQTNRRTMVVNKLLVPWFEAWQETNQNLGMQLLLKLSLHSTVWWIDLWGDNLSLLYTSKHQILLWISESCHREYHINLLRL